MKDNLIHHLLTLELLLSVNQNLEILKNTTSLDNFSFVTKKGVYQSFKIIKEAIKNLSETEIPVSNVICEPHLSKRKLYPTLSKISKFNRNSNESRNILNFLQYSDQTNSIYQISKLINLDIKKTFKIFNTLKKNKLIRS